MRATMKYLAVLIAFLALSPHSYSQTVGKVLKGITSVQVRVNDLNKRASACPITRNRIFESVAFTIASSQLSLSNTSSVVLDVEVIVIGIADRESGYVTCFADYMARVLTQQVVHLDATNLNRQVTIELWSRSRLLWAPRDKFRARVREENQRTTNAFIADWTLDQQ